MSAFFGAIVGVIVVAIVLVIAIVIWALNYSENERKNEKKSDSWTSYSDYAKKSKTFNYVSHEEFADLESKLYKSNVDQLTFSDKILKEIEELKDQLSKLENSEEKGE